MNLVLEYIFKYTKNGGSVTWDAVARVSAYALYPSGDDTVPNPVNVGMPMKMWVEPSGYALPSRMGN